ncbi:hypothetical protein FE257_006849 [Aspergillus nanangensis]|uniref:DUF7820 domain-containing protein n=1 Tax=Aspergillus nanangensis TaxID=2582783 RepID=A0AAD4GUS7_ASPNN|nr:hypothetical protein FE257_006849 [Aspergillus nanangensis]
MSSHDSDSMHQNTDSGRSSNPNVFSDEYSLDPLDSEQTTLTARSPSISSIGSSNTLRSSLPQQQQQQQPKPYNTVPTDLEVTENPFGDDARVSFDDTPHRSSLPQKGADLSNRNSITSMTQRSQSTSSRFSMPPRALSPYTGATGPSQPYAMYPQVGVSRSPSVTTTSTIRPNERAWVDTNAPQQPYSMYPQNVVPEEGIDAPPLIPMGFPGLAQTYQRPHNRADDDVADLVGPDGHTEQLPPYSRYPDGAAPKVGGTVESITDVGARPDETTPNEPEVLPVSEVSSRELVTEDQPAMRGHEPPAEIPATGVMAFEEKLKKKGKKKACCGLPIWTLVLIGVVFIVAACIGGVIGGVLGTKKAASDDQEKEKGPNIVTVTASPRMDATPITTTPLNLLPLPTGDWVIPADPKNQSKFCISDWDYTASWTCMTQGKIPISVSGTQEQPNISFPEMPSSEFTYGAQVPVFPSPTQSLSLMMDSSDMSLGPALTFFSLFDKLVIVPQDTFPSEAATKRSVDEDDVILNSFQRKQAARVGDKPWFCWWNSTVMEFFVYLNETTKESPFTASSTRIQVQPTASTSTSTAKREDTLLNYPRRIKMEEKRDYAEAHVPYCQQMQVMEHGKLQTASPETIQIKEREPTPTTTIKGDGSATQTYTAKAQYESVCYCVSLTD